MPDVHTPNFVVTGLTDYVNNNKDLIIGSFGLLGDGTRKYVTTLTGIKYKERLNYLEIEPELQDAENCGFTPQEGGLTLTEKDIVVVPIKVDIDICPRTLRKKFANYLVRMNAIEEGQRLPFEAEVINGVVDQINAKIETLIWQGNSHLESNPDLLDGWLYQLANDTDVIDVDTMPAGAYDGILAVYMALPGEVIKRGANIFVAPEIFRVFMQDMVSKNYFHYSGAVNEAPTEFILPGTNAVVVSAEGLANSLSIVGTWGKNLVYGTDMENDEEDIDLWYSKDDRIFKLEALWVSGVSYYFGNMIVLGTFSAAPTLAGGANEALAAIATNTAAIATNTEALGDVAEILDDVHNEAKNSLNTTATA